MHVIAGSHGGREPFVPVAIINAARYKAHKEADHPVLTGLKMYKTLIDTGATSSMISHWLYMYLI